jgi:hypothetical protein
MYRLLLVYTGSLASYVRRKWATLNETIWNTSNDTYE